MSIIDAYELEELMDKAKRVDALEAKVIDLREWIYEALNELGDPCDACDHNGSEIEALEATIANAIGKLRTAVKEPERGR